VLRKDLLGDAPAQAHCLDLISDFHGVSPYVYFGSVGISIAAFPGKHNGGGF